MTPSNDDKDCLPPPTEGEDCSESSADIDHNTKVQKKEEKCPVLHKKIPKSKKSFAEKCQKLKKPIQKSVAHPSDCFCLSCQKKNKTSKSSCATKSNESSNVPPPNSQICSKTSQTSLKSSCSKKSQTLSQKSQGSSAHASSLSRFKLN